MAVVEVMAMFGSDRATIHLDGADALAMRDLGNAGPLRMVLPFADGIASYFMPPSDVVPESIDEVVSVDSVAAFRGAMHLTHRDFLKKAELN